MSGSIGGIPTHVHMHTHTCTCMHAHVYMYRNCKWPLTWRHPCLSCLTCMCLHACMSPHVCTCMHAWDTPHTPIHPPPPHPPTSHPQGGGPRISKNSITLELIKIFQFLFEIGLDSFTHGWVYGLVGGLMGGVRSNH